MAGVNGRRGRRRGLGGAKKLEILEGARRVFRAEGFDGASMDGDDWPVAEALQRGGATFIDS